MANSGALLLGRRTYQDFYSYWPHQTDTLHAGPGHHPDREPLPRQNSQLLSGDADEAVAKLKEQPGKDIVVLASGERRVDLVR
jgi:dihydrofolate reductase